MRTLSTTVAVYADVADAEADWVVMELASEVGWIDLGDAAVVTRDGDGATTLRRHSHHGWGDGAVVGAVIPVLDLGAVMEPGAVALVVLSSRDTAAAAAGLLTGATKTLTRAPSTTEDVIPCACCCP